MAAQHDMGNYETLATLETFGFLPKFDAADIQAQIAYILPFRLTQHVSVHQVCRVARYRHLFSDSCRCYVSTCRFQPGIDRRAVT